jgi:hypothetical protein
MRQSALRAGPSPPFMACYRSNIIMSRYRCSWLSVDLFFGVVLLSAIVTNKGFGGVAPYVIGVGLPKSGTTSLYHYFQCSGYPISRYYCCRAINQTQYPCRGGRLMSGGKNEHKGSYSTI